MSSIRFSASDFTYPSAEEKSAAYKNFPSLVNFGFPFKNEIELFSEKTDPYDFKRRNNLYWWDHCLTKKIGKISNAYVNTIVNYRRGWSGNMISVRDMGLIRFQFDFYIESLYYYYFSARDIILQIVNVYIGEPLAEHKIDLKRLQDKKIDPAILQIIEAYYDDTKQAADIRNGLAHRFPINVTDNRAKIENDGVKDVYFSGSGKFVRVNELVDCIQLALDRLPSLITDLSSQMVIE